MKRYKKQKPKFYIKPGPMVKVSEAVTTFSINLQGTNKSGKKLVRAMDEHINKGKPSN